MCAKKITLAQGQVNWLTLSEYVKELLSVAYGIYTDLLRQPGPRTLVCGGQSPSYYCLAIQNFPIYRQEKVRVEVLPHSKGGCLTPPGEQWAENAAYSARLRERGILLRPYVTIVDGVHTGVGITALAAALRHYAPGCEIELIAISAVPGVPEIPVDREYISPSEPKFSDVFPRLVPAFHTWDFHDPEKFFPDFGPWNPLAEMIQELARGYPAVAVESTAWYTLNNTVTPEIKTARQQKVLADQAEHQRLAGIRARAAAEDTLKQTGGTFEPVVFHDADGSKIRCPVCGSASGTRLVLTHLWWCPNRYMTPV